MSSRVTSRIVIALGLGAVFAAGVSVILLEGQTRAPAGAPAAASRDLGPQDESAVARNAAATPATAPAAPPVSPSPGPQGQ